MRPEAPPTAYLAASPWIDADHPDVIASARGLSGGSSHEVTRRAFAWVRDEVRHSGDHRTGPVTCRASDVLRARTGYCYAKSHLLAALLRANGIPAGLAYQRLALGDGRFALHGLVAVDLPGTGWYRVDPRGNKPGGRRGDGRVACPPVGEHVDARFDPPTERLAFAVTEVGERDGTIVHAEPLPVVLATLARHATWDALDADLPDAHVD